jgi:hypothetical protein
MPAACLRLQNLVEKIVRSKIYDCQYWKEHCFGLTAESLIDKVRYDCCDACICWRNLQMTHCKQC